MVTKVEEKAPVRKKAAVPKPKAAVRKQEIHHVIRTISQDNSGAGGAWNVYEIEEYLQGYLNNGWVVQATHYLGQLPEGYVTMWVLTKG